MLILFFACLAVSLRAQPDVHQPGAHVEGRVITLNSESASALVRLQGVPDPTTPQNRPPTYSRNTSGDGKFVFDDIAPGTYTLTSYMEGFAPHPYGARSDTSPGAELVLNAGIELKELVLQMTPLGVVSGRVMDRDGHGLPGVSVDVYRSGPNGRTGGLGRTDEQGNYRVSKLPAGSYYVKATPHAITDAIPDRLLQSVSVVTFYPDAPDATSATLVNLDAGSDARGVDIRLRAVPAFSVRGTVVDRKTGAPAAGARIAALPPQSNAAALLTSDRVIADAAGRFEIPRLLPGTYVLYGSAVENWTPAGSGSRSFLGQPAGSARGRLKVAVGSVDVNQVVLELNAGATIAGKISMEGGDLKDWLPEPAADARYGWSIWMTPSEEIGAIAATAWTKEGIFLLKDVSPARYFFTVEGLPDEIYIKSIRLNGTDVTRSLLDLTSGSASSLEILLSPKAPALSGTVRNDKGQPMSDVPVTLWPKLPDRSSWTKGIKTAKTNGSGAFEISGVPPGDYFLAAWEYPDVQLLANLNFLARFASDELFVRLEESGHPSAMLTVVPHDRILAEAAKLP